MNQNQTPSRVEDARRQVLGRVLPDLDGVLVDVWSARSAELAVRAVRLGAELAAEERALAGLYGVLDGLRGDRYTQASLLCQSASARCEELRRSLRQAQDDREVVRARLGVVLGACT